MKYIHQTTMKISFISCFCDEKEDSGNPAAVVENFEGSDEQRQELAARLYTSDQMPVTVFVQQGNNEYSIRCFYPTLEMNMCIHGTLAAASLILQTSTLNECTFNTKTGSKIHVLRNQDCFQAMLEQKPVESLNIDSLTLQTLLNVTDEFSVNQDLPHGVYSVGSPKYLIPLNSVSELECLKPNFEAISQWSKETCVNGLYVYAPESGSKHDFIARAFNPKAGCNEDAATGVAVGALASVLKIPQLNVSQGQSIGRPCRLSASYLSEKDILVGGMVRFRVQHSDV